MSEQIRVVVAGIERSIDVGATAADVFAAESDVIAGKVGGELVDLTRELAEGDHIEPVLIGTPDGRSILRHSTAHVLAQAVQSLFPDAKLGIGPPIENGFYYDFDVSEPFHPDDLKRIEKRMQQIVKERQAFVRRPVTDEQARDELSAEPYKLELIGLKGAAAADAADGAEAEVGGRRADHLRQRPPQRRDRLEGPLPGPASPDDRTHPSLQAHYGSPPPTGGAASRTPSFSGSMAPAGRARTPSPPISSGWPRRRSATTAGWVQSWTCSPFRRRSVQVWPCSTPKVG